MIELRAAKSDDELEAWRSVRSAVLPNERTSSVAELRAGADSDTLWLLAYVEGELAGSGVSTAASTGGINRSIESGVRGHYGSRTEAFPTVCTFESCRGCP